MAMVTMKQIAARAGVSQTAVSFVLNERAGEMGLSEATVQRVREAMAEMDYRPNGLARAMVTGQSRMIGFLGGRPDREQFGYMLTGALEEADQHNFSLKVLLHAGEMRQGIERCVELRLAGVVVIRMGQSGSESVHEELARYGIPAVTLDSSFPQSIGSRVISDDQSGIRAVIEHLMGLGHRQIDFIGGAPASGAAVLREAAYHQAMRALLPDVTPRVARGSLFNYGQSEAAARELLQGDDRLGANRPTAIVCASDMVALIACREARRLGLQVPQDVSITGYAGLQMAALCDPPLTTVAQPFFDMGRMAVRHLVRDSQQPSLSRCLQEGEIIPPHDELMPVRLVVRASTGPPRDLS